MEVIKMCYSLTDIKKELPRKELKGNTFIKISLTNYQYPKGHLNPKF